MLTILRLDPVGSKIIPSPREDVGYWIYSPIDADILYRGNGEFEMKKFSNSNAEILFGRSEENSLRIRIGCAFRIQPPWKLFLKNPSNFPARIVSIREEFIESITDIWVEIHFSKKDQWAAFRRESGLPIAQLIPIRENSFDEAFSQEKINPSELIGLSSKLTINRAARREKKRIGNRIIFSGDTLQSEPAS